jgi:hypothetical protein
MLANGGAWAGLTVWYNDIMSFLPGSKIWVFNNLLHIIRDSAKTGDHGIA